jgi:AcrR family transcriptional regulator
VVSNTESDAGSNGRVRRPDPRGARTRSKLARAYTVLATREPGASLTVNAVVGEANVHRSSFYAHFGTTDELALYVLDQALIAISDDDAQVRLSGQVRGAEASRLVLGRILDQVERQRAELVAIFRSEAAWAARGRFGEQLRSRMLAYFDRLGVTAHRPSTQLDATATLLGHGLAAAITSWLLGELDCPRAELLNVLIGMVPDWVNDTSINPRTDG